MPKNIVMCCDGTGNLYGDRNSNVVRIYQVVARDAGQRVAYYHPGVGTIGATNALTTTGKVWTKFRGLAFGYGISDNIADAYRCLMHSYEPGDRIYIFGFSRGAYTARALCGMLEMLGLLSPSNEGLIPYAMRLFKRKDAWLLRALRRTPGKFQLADGFKKTFCSECTPYFVGLWDTVSSVGWILDPTGLKRSALPYTYSLKDVAVIRHAVSIDERRAFFRTNLVRDDPTRDIKEVWFAGVHSDVGGSYPEAESGLSKISLRWMLNEARAAGLRLDEAAVTAVMGGDPSRVPPLAAAKTHNSLTPLWWPGEIWPKWTKKPEVGSQGQIVYRGLPHPNLFRRRFIRDGVTIHESVAVRKQVVPGYAPSNLPANCTIERDPDPLPAYPRRLLPGETFVIGIHARATWNDTTVQVAQGETYELTADGDWYDASIKTDADGYPSPSLTFRLVQWLRRMPSANWFALIGACDRKRATQFLIGKTRALTVTETGILYCFANDLPGFYWNNSGHVVLTIKRLQ